MVENKKLKKLLIDHEMTIAALAKEIGITPTYMGEIINGRKGGYRFRGKIAKFFEVAYEDIWG